MTPTPTMPSLNFRRSLNGVRRLVDDNDESKEFTVAAVKNIHRSHENKPRSDVKTKPCKQTKLFSNVKKNHKLSLSLIDKPRLPIAKDQKKVCSVLNKNRNSYSTAKKPSAPTKLMPEKSLINVRRQQLVEQVHCREESNHPVEPDIVKDALSNAKVFLQRRAQLLLEEQREKEGLKKERDKERNEARIALEKVARSVDVCDNIAILKDLELLDCLHYGMTRPLEQFGLYLKDDEYTEDDQLLDIEEGEIVS